MPPFICTCQKSFTTQHRLNAHRANSVRCKQRWNDYVANFSSTISVPNQQDLTDDIVMEDMEDIGSGEGAMDASPMVPASADELSGDDLETEEPENKGENDSLSDISSDETYQYASAADTDSGHEDSGSNSDDDEFEAIEHLGSPSATSQPGQHRSTQETPRSTEPLAPYVEAYPHAGLVKERMVPMGFHESAQAQSTQGAGNTYYPFANEMDFELGTWLHESGLAKAKIDEFLKLKYVQDRMPSFGNASVLYERIEQLPDGGPRWKQQRIVPEYGNPIGSVTLYYRDAMEAVAHLLSRPALAPHLEFQPKKVWETASKATRVYGDMSHGEWWWGVQATLVDGATVLPLVLGSDKTHLTNFSGDKKAWPVYLTLGNISPKARRTPSLNAWIIIGYMPITAWNNPDDIWGTLSNRLFHQCAKVIFQSIVQPGARGVLLMDSFGQQRHCFPRLAAWLSDYPEQVLLNCAAWGTCPVTLAQSGSLGNAEPSPPRTTTWILEQISHVISRVDPADIKKYQDAAKRSMLSGVHKPFWENLPGYQAHLCVAPDLFHGVIRFGRDHILKWTKRLVGVSEFDARLKALQDIPGFRHFKKGIDHLSQLTGREDRELQRITVAIIAGAPKVSPKAMRCIRAFHDFLYLTQYRSHDQKTIKYLSDALKIFHATKNVFIETGARRGKGKTILNHFEIPKIAAFHSYEWHIPHLGPSTQFSTEIIETIHKPLAKWPYKATNRQNYAVQMCRYLDRSERVKHAREMHAWLSLQSQIENQAAALHGLSPRHQLRVKDIFFRPKEQGTSNLEKSREGTSLWLNLQPTLHKTTLHHLATIYQLPTLVADVDKYLREPQDDSEIIAMQGVTEVLHVDAWEKLRIHIADVQDDEAFSRIHTVQALPPGAQGGRYPYGHGHCVLVHTGEAEAVGIAGYDVAQVRLIFKVHLQATNQSRHYLGQRGTLPHRPFKHQKTIEPRSVVLAYVQYFDTPARPDEDILMYRVSRADRTRNPRNGAVIPLESISRFIQLVPRFDARVDPQISSETSMEICRSYYINSFATTQIYQSVY